MKKPEVSLFVLILTVSAIPVQAAERVIFEDNFDTPASYHAELTRNATHKEYGNNSLAAGHLLKKWLYSWDYDADGDWQQAFYVVAPGETVMTQAGRSACRGGNYRIVADAPIPEDAGSYTITFRQMKADNDPLFYVLGAGPTGWSDVRFGFENQLPGTDQTVDDIYLRGLFGDGVIKRGLAHRNQWVDVVIHVDLTTKVVSWKMADTLVGEAHAPALKPGGYFGLYMCFDRSGKFDDFKITVAD